MNRPAAKSPQRIGEKEQELSMKYKKKKEAKSLNRSDENLSKNIKSGKQLHQ